MNVGEIVSRPLVVAESGASRAAAVKSQIGPPPATPAGEDAWTAEAAHDPQQDKDILAEAEKKLGQALESLGVDLKFHVDESTDKLQVEIIEPESGKVLRKLPPDDLLKLARSVQEMARGFLDKMY